MGQRNPYMQDADVTLPTRKFRVTFLPMNVTVEVDPARLPYGQAGRPGSLLDIALAHGVDIDHACGGVCACSTCHVIVREGIDSLCEAADEEEDMLDNSPGLTHSSRLACQAVPGGGTDVIVEVPEWSRNLAKEQR